MTFNNVELTSDTILATRQWFHDNALDCIKEAVSGQVSVNNLSDYVEWRIRQAEADLNGENDNTFTFLQRAYYIQTGETVALLP